MTKFNPTNREHVAIAQSAAEESYLNCVGTSRAVREALSDEGVLATEEAYSMALQYLREWHAANGRAEWASRE